MPDDSRSIRSSPLADAIREHRLIAVLRRVAPRSALLDLVDGLSEAGVHIFEVTLDGTDAAGDLAAVRAHLEAGAGETWVGAGTVRTTDDVSRAVDAGAAFGVSPVLDRAVLAAAADRGLPFIPGAWTPTEIDVAWRSGAMFVKLFPASSAGPSHVREVRAPLPEVELIVTGGVDRSNAADFLAAGAVAVGVGSALVRANAAERRALAEAVRSSRVRGESRRPAGAATAAAARPTGAAS